MNRLVRYALGLMVEEMGEALQLIGKALRFGLDAPGPDRAPYFGKSARQLLPTELGDIRASIAYAGEAGVVNGRETERRADDKIILLLDPSSVDTSGNRLAPDPFGRDSSDPADLVDGILAWIRQRDRAVLFSEVEEAFGPRARSTFDLIIRNGHVRAVFPEAKPGDSGRQFWELVQ